MIACGDTHPLPLPDREGSINSTLSHSLIDHLLRPAATLWRHWFFGINHRCYRNRGRQQVEAQGRFFGCILARNTGFTVTTGAFLTGPVLTNGPVLTRTVFPHRTLGTRAVFARAILLWLPLLTIIVARCPVLTIGPILTIAVIIVARTIAIIPTRAVITIPVITRFLRLLFTIITRLCLWRLNARLRTRIELVAVEGFVAIVAAVIALRRFALLPAFAARLIFFVARARIG